MLRHALWASSLLCGCRAPELGLEPSQGGLGGGDEVYIDGEDLRGHGALVVGFGGVPARGVVIESDHRVRVKSPPATEVGVVDVRLDFADGTTRALPAAFEYRPVQGVRIGR